MNQRPSQLDAFYRFLFGGYLFALVLAIYPGTDSPTIHIKELISTWTAGVLAGSYVLVHWITGRPLRRPAIFAEVIVGLLALFAISTALSDYFRYSLLETGRFFALFALYWLASQIYRTPQQVLRLFTVFCTAIFVAGLYAVLQKAGLDPFPWKDTESDTYTNLPATFGNPNFAAHAIILALIMIVCLVRSGATWAGWIVAPVLFFHFYSTGQRAGWIALAGAALLAGLAFLLLRRTRRPLLGVTITLCSAAVIGAAAVAGTMYYTHVRTGQVFPLDLSLLLRYQSYVSATDMLLDAPLLGHGPAVYGQAYPPYWTPYEQEWYAQETRMNQHVHNDILELAIDGGLGAAGIYLAMLVLGVCYGLLLAARGRSDTERRLGYTFAALFAAFGIDGLFGFNLRVPVTAALFFVMMGTLDGLWTRPQPEATAAGADRAWPGHLARLAFLALLVLCVWQESRRFAGEYHYYRGLAAQTAGEYESATTAYEKALKYADWNWKIHGRLGLTRIEEGRPDLGVPHLEAALDRNPHYFLAHLPMSRAYLLLAQAAASKKDPGAEAYLDRARNEALEVLKTVPSFPAANDLLGRVESIAAILNRDNSTQPDPAVQAAHWRKAQGHLQAAIDHGADKPGELYRMLVQVESALGNIDGAEQALLGALRAAPEEERTWPLLIDFARKNNRFDRLRGVLFRQIDQLQEIEAPTQADTDQLVQAYRGLAVFLEEGSGDMEGAADALARTAELGPKSPEVWSRYAAFARKNGRMDAFYASIQSSCEQLRAKNDSPLAQAAAVDMALRNPGTELDQATRLLLGSVQSHPRQGSPEIVAELGWAAEIVQEAYTAQFDAGTAPCESSLNLGIVAVGLGNLELANTLFERTMGCATGEQRAITAAHWGNMLIRVGFAEKALPMLRDTLTEFPNHLDAQWALARTLAALGKREEARGTYEQLLTHPEIVARGKELVQAELDRLPPP